MPQLVPDPFPVGMRVRIFPDVIGVVVAVRGSKRIVETGPGNRHEIGLGALLPDEVRGGAGLKLEDG